MHIYLSKGFTMTPQDANIDHDIQAIENLLNHFEQAIVQGDALKLPDLLCEQSTALFTVSSDLIRGRDAIVKMWQHHMHKWTDVVINRHTTLVRIHGDVAWANFYWDGEGTAHQNRYRITNERWSVVLLWEEGDWRLAQMHTSLPYQNWEAHKL
jgi:uncharacterized protein (TIGR02246 family)